MLRDVLRVVLREACANQSSLSHTLPSLAGHYYHNHNHFHSHSPIPSAHTSRAGLNLANNKLDRGGVSTVIDKVPDNKILQVGGEQTAILVLSSLLFSFCSVLSLLFSCLLFTLCDLCYLCSVLFPPFLPSSLLFCALLCSLTHSLVLTRRPCCSRTTRAWTTTCSPCCATKCAAAG